ncbi:MAG TPA: MmoB/DmpM family protein [Polyangiaceae bacterium]|nr:MmoB/DmpM family protein [Polyangiaceae bacterium]
MPDKDEARLVGPVLQKGEAGDAVVAAILAQNPQATVVDRGAYLRVLVPGLCRVTRAAIERERGAPFCFPSDLEMIMSSFQGRLEMSEESAVWCERGRLP